MKPNNPIDSKSNHCGNLMNVRALKKYHPTTINTTEKKTKLADSKITRFWNSTKLNQPIKQNAAAEITSITDTICQQPKRVAFGISGNSDLRKGLTGSI